jgi:hypothetical protein
VFEGYAFEDCVGFCFNDDDCTNGSCLDWVGDGYCDDGTWGLNLNCEEWDFDGGDCEGTNCGSGYVDDCSGDGDCCPESWLGDDYCDDENQEWGCDLMCFDAEASDCGGRTTPAGNKVNEAIKFVLSDGFNNYSFNSTPLENDGKRMYPNPLSETREFVLIASTNATEYLDSDVINDTEYCYYTTAENEAGESGASDVVCATPTSGSVADVMLSMGDLSINVGETDGLDLNMDNEDAVAGFQFSLISSADVGEIVDVITTERTEGFTCSTANNIVICFSLTGDVIEPGSGAFIVVEVLGTSGGTAEVCYDDVVLSNPDGVEMSNQTSCGSVAVTDEPIEYVLMSVMAIV